MSKPTFTLTLEAQPRPGGDHDGTRRLRALLKYALRVLGLKALKAERSEREPTTDQRRVLPR